MCRPQQSLNLVDIVQIDYKEFFDIQVEEIYLEGVILCASMSSRVIYLDVFLSLQLVPPSGGSSLELVCNELDMLLLGNIRHVKELLYFISPVQEGFNIKVPTKRKNLNLHPIFIRI